MTNKHRLFNIIKAAEDEHYKLKPHGSDDERIIRIVNHLAKNNAILLPCKLGSTVWVIKKSCAEPFPAEFRLDDLDQFGKRVFLSRAEAWRMMKGERR